MWRWNCTQKKKLGEGGHVVGFMSVIWMCQRNEELQRSQHFQTWLSLVGLWGWSWKLRLAANRKSVRNDQQEETNDLKETKAEISLKMRRNRNKKHRDWKTTGSVEWSFWKFDTCIAFVYVKPVNMLVFVNAILLIWTFILDYNHLSIQCASWWNKTLAEFIDCMWELDQVT